MFNTLRHVYKNQIKEKDRFFYIKPSLNLICDMSRYLENFETPLIVNDMYLEDELLIILSEDGTIYLVNIMDVQMSKIKNNLNKNNFYVRELKNFSTKTKFAKSISINQTNNSLLIVYLTKESNTTAELKCSMINLNQLKEYVKGTTQNIQSVDIFVTENLSSPAFVEFDEFNSKIITRNSLATYKVWNMKDLKLIFELTDKRIEEIRTADGIFMTIRSVEANDKLLLSIYDIENGKLVINYEVDLIVGVELEILEIFDRVLLLKQAGNPPLIVNLITFEYNIIKNDQLDEKSMFMFINKSNLFATLHQNYLIFYSMNGEEMRSIKNENIENISPNFVHLTQDKNYLLVYWEERHNHNNMNTGGNKNYTYIKTPKSKNIASKNSKILLNQSGRENSLYISDISEISRNISVSSDIKSSSEFYFSEFKSNTGNKNTYNIETPKKSETKLFPLFKGELELICLKETAQVTKLNINSDNIKYITQDYENENDEIMHEPQKVSYFTYNSKTMRIYVLMQSGRLYECAI
jgi:hypothetical protein